MPLSLLLPVLLVQAPAAPPIVELAPRLYVLKGAPNPATYQALVEAHITYVIDLRRDGEPGANQAAECAALAAKGIHYYRYAISAAPPRADFQRLREIIRELPAGARILIHCGDGNRASAVVCAWMVMDRNYQVDQALELAHGGGLRRTDTEEALRGYLKAMGRG